MTLLLAPVLLMIFAKYFVAPTDNDYWWHVRTGQQIVERGEVPREDSFSYTVTGQSWVAHEWLTDVALYLVQDRLGYGANVALFGLIGGATALAVYAACRARGLGETAAAVLTLWAAVMAMGSANVRPQALTTLLLAITALLLTWYKGGHARALWPLPALFALWVNLHGGWAIGLALLALTVAGESFDRLLGRKSAPLQPLVVIGALSLLATMLNPHGPQALGYPLSYLGTDNAMMRFIAEWQSPDFHRPERLLFAASLGLAMLLGLARRPLGATEVLWAAVLALMALQSVRHVALYAVVATPLLAARLAGELPALSRPLASWRHPRLLAVTWLLLGVVVFRLAVVAGQGGLVQLGRQPSDAGYPAGAVAYLKGSELSGNLFNSYDWGGYLIYHLHPRQPVFIDGRTDLYGAFVGKYLEAAQVQPGWRSVLDEYGVEMVLVERTSPLASALAADPDWRVLFAGPVERLYGRIRA